MKLGKRERLFVTAICTVEQWTVLVGSIWLIGWKEWSPWWFAITILLMGTEGET